MQNGKNVDVKQHYRGVADSGTQIAKNTDNIPKMSNPVKSIKIRMDKQGSGQYLSSRPKNTSKVHEGVDLEVKPGDPIFSMGDGVVKSVEVYPYRNTVLYTGIRILYDNGFTMKIFYMAPNKSLKKDMKIKKGDLIGNAQDISLRYNKPDTKKEDKMLPHIHLEMRDSSLKHYDPNLFLLAELT